jgi:hypothetical protein
VGKRNCETALVETSENAKKLENATRENPESRMALRDLPAMLFFSAPRTAPCLT